MTKEKQSTDIINAGCFYSFDYVFRSVEARWYFSKCLVAQLVKKSACNTGDVGSILWSERFPGEGNSDPLENSAWRIPWTEEPGGPQSMASQRVRHG